MDLLLHIGTTKTGSSSIQYFCKTNRERLRNLGVAYPSFPGVENHRGITVYAVDYARSKDLNRQIGNDTAEQCSAYKEAFVEGFDNELRTFAGAKTFVLSSEHLHSRCTTLESIGRLKEFLCSRFEKISVLCYLRPQIEHAVSLYSTLLRHGYQETLEEFLEDKMSQPNNPYFNFKKFLSPWVDIFGKDRLKVKLYDDTRQLKRGVLSDFQSEIGVDVNSEEFAYTPRRSVSNSQEAEVVLLTRNRALEKSKRPEGFDAALANLISNHLPGSPRMPDIELAKRFQAKFEESNTWIAREWFDSREVLEPNWSKFEKPAAAPHFGQEFVTGLLELAVKGPAN